MFWLVCLEMISFQLGEGREALAKYVAKYKNFSEEFSTVVQCLAMEELDPNQGKALLHQLGSLEKMIGKLLCFQII
jgi:hypothetical protein